MEYLKLNTFPIALKKEGKENFITGWILRDCWILKETEKAILLSGSSSQNRWFHSWIPKSVCTVEGENNYFIVVKDSFKLNLIESE